MAQSVRGVRAAEQQRHLEAMRRHRRHHRAFDIARRRRARRAPRPRDLRAGRGRIEIEEEAAGAQAGRACRGGRDGLAGGDGRDDELRRRARRRRATPPASRRGATRAAQRTRRAGPELQIERRHLVAAARADPRRGCVRPRRSRSAPTMHRTCIRQSMYRRPAAASGSRISYMSRPSTPAASLARFVALVRLALRGGVERRCGHPARHDRRRRRRRRRSRRPGCTSAPAQTTGMLTEPSVALTVPLALIARLQTGKPHRRSAPSRRGSRRR